MKILRISSHVWTQEAALNSGDLQALGQFCCVCSGNHCSSSGTLLRPVLCKHISLPHFQMRVPRFTIQKNQTFMQNIQSSEQHVLPYKQSLFLFEHYGFVPGKNKQVRVLELLHIIKTKTGTDWTQKHCAAQTLCS